MTNTATLLPSHKFRIGVLSILVCASVVLGQGCALAGSPAAGKAAADHWTKYQNTQYGFSIDRPTGWTVHVDQNTILVQSADRSAFSLIESFTPTEGEDAQAHVATIPSAEADLLPSATVDRVSPSSTGANDDGAIAAISYQGALGSGSARVLCSITPQRGLLFAMAAPSARFGSERTALLRILKSLSFGTQTATRTGHPSGSIASPALKITLASLQYIPWKDPNEGAFHLDVPKGWDVQGGLYHVAVSDSRSMVMAHSPEAGVTILLSDSSIPIFTKPNSLILQEGYKIGAPFTMNGNSKSILYDYMPAQDFNHWYLQTHLSQYVDALEITGDKDRPDMVTTAEAYLAKGPMGRSQHTITASETAFSGRDKATGQPIRGAIISRTTDFPLPARYGGGTWSAVPNLYVYTADGKASVRKAIAVTAMSHMNKTMQLDPGWVQRDQQKQQEVLQEIQREGAAVLQQRYEQYTAQADAKRAEINENFLENMGAKANGERKELNSINGMADVVNPNTGMTAKVPWGYSHYDQDEKSGVITGSNEPYGTQDLGLTPLSKF